MFNIPAFLQTLPVMLYGMGGIFAVILLIWAIIEIFGKIFKTN